MAEFLTTEKGRRKLVYEGYAYIRESNTAHKTHWRCERKGTCTARLHTKLDPQNGDPVFIRTTHCHPPDHARVEVLKTLEAIKIQAVTTKEGPQKIVNQILHSLDPDIAARLPRISCMKRQVNRNRVRKSRPRSPNVNLLDEDLNQSINDFIGSMDAHEALSNADRATTKQAPQEEESSNCSENTSMDVNEELPDNVSETTKQNAKKRETWNRSENAVTEDLEADPAVPSSSMESATPSHKTWKPRSYKSNNLTTNSTPIDSNSNPHDEAYHYAMSLVPRLRSLSPPMLRKMRFEIEKLFFTHESLQDT